MSRRTEGAVAAVLAVVLAVVAIAAAGSLPIEIVGPLAATVLWVPPALWAIASFMPAGAPASVRVVRFLARAACWVALALVLADPARNGPDIVASAGGDGLAQLASVVRSLLTGLAAIVVGGFFLSVLAGGSSPAPDSSRRRVTRGSAVHPLVAIVLRVAIRLAVGMALLTLELFLAAVAWTIDGIAGIRALDGSSPAPGRAIALLAAARRVIRAGAARALGLVRRASDGWGVRTSTGVWIEPAVLERDADGVVSRRPWRGRALTADDAALIELAALLDAYDVALNTPKPRAALPGGDAVDSRQAPALRLAPYRIAIARAWASPDRLSCVIAVSPPAAAAAAGRVTVDQLAPTLDALTTWTADDLRGLRLSDPRVAADPLRGDARGLFIGLDRPRGHVGSDRDDDPVRRPITRALREAGLHTRFHHHLTDEADDGTLTLTYRASFRTAAEWAELERAWMSCQAAIALYLRRPGVKLATTTDPAYGFLVRIPPPDDVWPSGQATDWGTVTRRHPVDAAHPSRVILGLDRRGEPVPFELAGDRSHLLIGGASGSGKSTALGAVVVGLLANDLALAERGIVRPPTELILVEAVKRDLVRRLGPACWTALSTTTGSDAIPVVADFLRTIEQRYRDLDGRPFDPSTIARRVLVIEEYGSLRLALDRDEGAELERILTAIANTGRAAGSSLVIALQKGSAETIPTRLRVNMSRISGWYPTAQDYGVILDRPTRALLPRIPGRLAMQGIDGDVITLQGLRPDDTDIDAVVQRWVARFGAGAPSMVADDASDDPLPRLPTAAEVASLDALAVARVIYRRQARHAHPLAVSVRGAIEWARDEGLVPGRQEGWTRALAELEALGILEPASDYPTAPRRVAVPYWPEARSRLMGDPPSELPD